MSKERSRCFLFVSFLVLSVAAMSQHTRQALLQPACSDFNLAGSPRQLTVVQRYDQGNDINFQETYLFDTTGRLSEYRKRGFGGENVTRYPLASLPQNRRYSFDYDGDLLELRQYNQLGKLSGSTHYIYAKGGNLAMTVEYLYDVDSSVVTKRTVSMYDKRERLVTTEQYTADELLLMKEKRKYDRRGNLVKRHQTFYGEEGTDSSEERRKYTYDSHGNWITCRYSMNGRVVYTKERTIEYFGEK